MKKIFSISVIAAFAFCLFTSTHTQAQKVKFAGTVKFHVRFEGDTDPQRHVPQDVMYTIFGNKIMAKQQIFIQMQDGDAVTKTLLIDYPGSRIGYITPKEEIQEEQALLKYTYTKGSETKTICGYVCNKYDVSIYDAEEDEETKFIVYTTTEIGNDNNINSTEYPGLTGYPLYTEIERNDVKTIIEATEVKKTKIKAVDFLIPSDYKMYNTAEEFGAAFQELFGGGEE
jgi:hypothetical protein